MARWTRLRSLLAASLLALSAAAAVVAVPAVPAGAVDNNYVDVMLTANGFIPHTVYARPGDKVRFSLDTSDPTMTRDHTVTLEAGRCDSLPNQLCEKNFDDPANPPIFRFSTADQYPYFDRIALEQSHQDVRGTIVVTDQPPVTTTTAAPTTSTTARPAQATTTTTAGSVRPFVMDEPAPGPTTTTTTPAHLSVVTLPAPAPKPADTGAAAGSDNPKAKGKAAAGPATTTTTAAPATTDASVLDQASLIPTTPLPAASVTPEADPPVEDVTSTAADLLHTDHGADGDTRLMILAIAGLAVFLLGGGAIGWFRRSSRYFPA